MIKKDDMDEKRWKKTSTNFFSTINFFFKFGETKFESSGENHEVIVLAYATWISNLIVIKMVNESVHFSAHSFQIHIIWNEYFQKEAYDWKLYQLY